METMKKKRVFELKYINCALQDDHTLFVAQNIDEAFERGKQLLKELNGHSILGINYNREIWM